MQIDKRIFQLDNSGESSAYFSKKSHIVINKKNIKKLIRLSLTKKADLRICMHRNINANLQTMINILLKKNEYFYSAHVNTDEVYHIIEGKLLIIFFHNKIKKKILLNSNNKLFIMQKKTVHVTIPISKYCVIHETRNGPFDKKDNIFLNKVNIKDYNE
jgi:cupin fold WbuC family metalloprotein